MKRLLLALLLLPLCVAAAPQKSSCQSDECSDCTTYWMVRITYWAPLDGLDKPWRPTTHEIGPMTQVREDAEAKRDDILAHGWQWPLLQPGQQSETRVAPGGILYCSVKQVCCRTIGPPGDWCCVYPDGNPPPAL